MQEARLAHGGVPDHDEAELVDPDSLHRFGAPRAQGQVVPRELSLQHRRGCAPARFQHLPAAAAAAWSPPSGEGGAGPRAGGVDLYRLGAGLEDEGGSTSQGRLAGKGCDHGLGAGF